MKSKTIKLLDVVALTVDLPQYNLWQGQVGTVVEILANGLRLKSNLVTIARVALMNQLGCVQSKSLSCILNPFPPILNSQCSRSKLHNY